MKQTGNYHEGYIDGVDSRLGEIQNLKDEIESLTTKLKQESECVDFMKETTDNYEKEIERLKGEKSRKDKLFDLANEFAGNEFGHIAVKLHLIHNSLNQ